MRHFLEANQPLQARVLYVEDSRDQRLLMQEQLTSWGLSVAAFDSADAAWPAFQSEIFDLVLCDVVLDGRMSGARLINRIRRQPLPQGGVPILAGCCASFQCRQFARHPGGDHVVFIGEVLAFERDAERRPLLFQGGAYRRLAD